MARKWWIKVHAILQHSFIFVFVPGVIFPYFSFQREAWRAWFCRQILTWKKKKKKEGWWLLGLPGKGNVAYPEITSQTMSGSHASVEKMRTISQNGNINFSQKGSGKIRRCQSLRGDAGDRNQLFVKNYLPYYYVFITMPLITVTEMTPMKRWGGENIDWFAMIWSLK